MYYYHMVAVFKCTAKPYFVRLAVYAECVIYFKLNALKNIIIIKDWLRYCHQIYTNGL